MVIAKQKNYGTLNSSIRCFVWYVAIVMYIINRDIVNILKIVQCEKSESCTSKVKAKVKMLCLFLELNRMQLFFLFTWTAREKQGFFTTFY